MPSAVSPGPEPRPAAHDDLDDLFADLIGNDASNRAGQNNHLTSNEQPNDIDEEIKVAKKRKPVAKLDETRLLSAAGVPKLRKMTKDKLRFNGKGNEFTDMARLLNTYQLWLDDLFPKAKFLDGLAMVEKLGHRKKIQMYRKEWIDEGKPKSADADLDDFLASREEQESERRMEEAQDQGHNLPLGGGPGVQDTSVGNDEPGDDELDSLLGETASAAVQKPMEDVASRREYEDPDEDELDALMAEEGQSIHEPKSLFGGPSEPASRTVPPDDFDDDEEAMAGMDW